MRKRKELPTLSWRIVRQVVWFLSRHDHEKANDWAFQFIAIYSYLFITEHRRYIHRYRRILRAEYVAARTEELRK